MQIRCPDCHSVFLASKQQLKSADGMVRCGQCSKVFNGLEHVMSSVGDHLKQKDLFAPDHPEDDMEHIVLETPESELDFDSFADMGGETDEQPEAAHDPAAIPSVLHRELESAFEPPVTRSSLPWRVFSVLMVLMLAAQLIYFNFPNLMQEPAGHRVMQKACRFLGCEVGPLRDVAAFELVDRNIYSHPNESGALVITATFKHNAPFAQPYPLLQVSLTNLQGKIIATRRFMPIEYLSGTDVNEALPTGVPVSVSLEVIDPGENALAFEFDII